ncbi:hypothetical protein [Paraburkholderia hayleyella]|uniref:hypothetical protein n=1 Tax=Paraburkholderia hayleyella TaxID=2152889 RepID=UPI001291F002|nr:hypothetical protein [Paraburkholderia hayleyella]
MSARSDTEALSEVCDVVSKRAEDSAEKLRFAREVTQAAAHENEVLQQRVEQHLRAAKDLVTMLDRELSAAPATERKVNDNNARIKAKYEELALLREAARESEKKLEEARDEEMQARNLYVQARQRQQKLEDTVTHMVNAKTLRATRVEDNELDEVALQLHQQHVLQDAEDEQAGADRAAVPVVSKRWAGARTGPERGSADAATTTATTDLHAPQDSATAAGDNNTQNHKKDHEVEARPMGATQ